MAEYTYDNILINPTKEGIESLIGKEVYCHENPYLCLKNANKKSTDFLGVLMKIHKDSNNPFCVKQNDGVYKYPCIIEKKEEPKPKYVPFESKWEFIESYMDNRSNHEYLDHQISCLGGIWLKDKDREGAYFMVTEIWDSGIVIGDKSVTIGETVVFHDITAWEELLKNYTFLWGTPCGKLAEEDK